METVNDVVVEGGGTLCILGCAAWCGTWCLVGGGIMSWTMISMGIAGAWNVD